MTFVRPGAIFFGMLACLLGSVAAAGASSSTSAGGGAFCSVSKGVGTNLVNIAKQLQTAPSPTRLKAEWGAITSAAPALKSSAPASLKTPVVKVLAFANIVGTDLAKANWHVSGLYADMGALEVQEKKAGPSIAALKAYYKGTCKFDV